MATREELETLKQEIADRNRVRTLSRLQRVRALLAGCSGQPVVETVRIDLHALIGALGAVSWSGGPDLLGEIQDRVYQDGPYDDLLPAFDKLVAEVDAGRPATPWR